MTTSQHQKEKLQSFYSYLLELEDRLQNEPLDTLIMSMPEEYDSCDLCHTVPQKEFLGILHRHTFTNSKFVDLISLMQTLVAVMKRSTYLKMRIADRNLESSVRT